MEITQAKELALNLMAKHGLRGWAFGTFKSLRCLGRCNYGSKTISLSEQFIQHGDGEAIKDTILHEIAHALVPEDGHGLKWKRKAMEIGAKPETCGEVPEVFSSISPYRGICRACGAVMPILRNTTNVYGHRNCPKAWKDHTIDIVEN